MNIFQETIVDISLKRYEALINLETRVNVAVKLMENDKYINKEDILMILGTPEALSLAEKLIAERKDLNMKSDALEEGNNG